MLKLGKTLKYGHFGRFLPLFSVFLPYFLGKKMVMRCIFDLFVLYSYVFDLEITSEHKLTKSSDFQGEKTLFFFRKMTQFGENGPYWMASKNHRKIQKQFFFL